MEQDKAQPKVEIGTRPWLASRGGRSLKEWDRWNMPTAGLVRQADTIVLFECIGNPAQDVNEWRYVIVTPAEARQADVLNGEDLMKMVDALFSDGRPVVTAEAVSGYIRDVTNPT